MPVVVDVGVGDEATTTVEMLDRLIPGCTVVGTEVEEWRLQALEKSTLPSQVQLRRGSTDFELPVRGGEAVHVIRAMNVLRDYHPQDALKALHTLSADILQLPLNDAPAIVQATLSISLVVAEGERPL
eukprot:gene4464-5475_t